MDRWFPGRAVAPARTVASVAWTARSTNTGATDVAFFDGSPGFVPEALIDGIGMGLAP